MASGYLFPDIYECPVFYRMRCNDPTEDVAVNRFPEEILIAGDFLEQADPRYVYAEDGDIIFDCENGTARYRIIAFGQHPMKGAPVTFLAKKVG